MTAVPDMKDIVALCKRRGFVFPASDIYGGLNGFWDYGPLGVELKNNLRDLWWKRMVLCPPIGPDGEPVEIVGVDTSIIQNPKAWVASGHVGGFSDPMVDDKETKLRYRADHLRIYFPEQISKNFPSSTNYNEEMQNFINQVKELFNNHDFFIAAQSLEELEAVHKKTIKKHGWTFRDGDWTQMISQLSSEQLGKVWAPGASKPGTLTEPKQFNLMFHTFVGATGGEDNKAYLRPETAQGIFLNFKNVLDSSRVKMPFGIAQIGKAFRNEVTPRNFIFRSREFEQMEMEWFCKGEDAKKWQDFWFKERVKFWKGLGLSDKNLQIRNHDQDELSHYAKAGLGTADIEYKFPFTAPGFGELEGIAHRCDFDLTQHQEHSGQKLEYFDPVTNERYMPHVIEPAAGLTRGALALICEAYTVDKERPSGVYLNFHPSIAPKKAAILPLTAKEDHVPLAQKLYFELREDFAIDLDIKQNIGKRYARQDEIGTPVCFTVDNDTINDHTVTARDRNTMKQERIHMDKVAEYLRAKMKPAQALKNAA